MIATLKNRTLSPVVERFIECAREVAKTMGGEAARARATNQWSRRQNTTTLLMLLPSCIRSKPLLMSASGMVWVIIGSI